MKEFKISPLNVLGGRRFDFLPPHIEPIEVGQGELFFSKDSVLDWIESNLKHRYFCGTLSKLVDNKVIVYRAVAFEDPHETTLFLLGCPLLAKNKIDL
jgi:hypothetical protein